jgi:hypothetical protein
MEHPLVMVDSSLSIDELSAKISELNKKLGIAQRTGNGWVCEQIRMAIEAYQNRLRERSDEALRGGSNNNFDEIIDIS